MKNLAVVLALMFSILVVNAQDSDKKKSRKEKRAEREAQLVKQTKEVIEAKAWQFDANQVLPAKGRSQSLTTSYSVTVKDDKVDSYLPYFGRAYNPSYGSTSSPMIFEGPIENYTVEDAKKGGYTIKFSTRNENDRLDYTFNIASNGSATLSVNSTNRQHISYYGDIVPVKEKEEKE